MLLLDALYDINKHLGRNNSILEKIQIKRILRVTISIVTNKILPFFLEKSRGTLIVRDTVPIIVSMTSFPARINKVWMTIESILIQQKKPKMLILWLSREQFPNEENDLPNKLIEQQKRGLTIRFVDGDIRSHKKYYYSFREYKDELVLTLDDDLLFHSNFIKSIYDCKQKHPNDIIASFGFRYVWDDDINYIHPSKIPIKIGDSETNLFFGSGGGTLFNSSIANKMDTIEKIMELCPTADDIYLNALIRICGFRVTFHMNNPLLSVKSKDNVALVNNNGDIYDNESVNALQLKNLVSYYENNNISNPFKP